MELRPSINSQEVDSVLLEAAKVQASRLGADPLIVLVGGSFKEGFSTQTSDFDVVVVYEPSVTSSGVRLTTAWVQGKKLELLLYTLSDFLRLGVRGERISADGNTFYFLDSRRRLLHSRPILGAEMHRAALQNADMNAFSNEVFAYHASLSFKAITDLRGALIESNGTDTVLIRLRGHLERLTDAFLILLGDFYFRPKWRCERVQRSFAKDSRLKGLIDETCAFLSGRALSSFTTCEGALNRMFRLALQLEYLIWFFDFWKDTFSAADLEHAESNVIPAFLSVAKNRDGSFRVLSKDAAFSVPADVAHALALRSLRIDKERQACIESRFYARCGQQGLSSLDSEALQGAVAQAISKLNSTV